MQHWLRLADCSTNTSTVWKWRNVCKDVLKTPLDRAQGLFIHGGERGNEPPRIIQKADKAKGKTQTLLNFIVRDDQPSSVETRGLQPDWTHGWGWIPLPLSISRDFSAPTFCIDRNMQYLHHASPYRSCRQSRLPWQRVTTRDIQQSAQPLLG